MRGTCGSPTASRGVGGHPDASRTALSGPSRHAKESDEPERLDAILRRMGLVPDGEDRIRRLELVAAELAQMLAEEIEARVSLERRVQEMEASLGRLRRGR